MVKCAAMFSNLDSSETQPHIPDTYLADTRPIRVSSRKKKRGRRYLTLLVLVLALFLGLLLSPGRMNVLIIGLDRAPEGTSVARSDTLILTSVQPHRPYAAMLSIPRDLWVEIPGVGYNRINTAHFFAEGTRTGSGPAAAISTIEHNFGIDINEYIRLEFDGLVRFVDALGGVPISLESPVGKLGAGEYVLSGEQALAYVRDRSGTDDFFRMEHGRMFIQAVMKRMSQPSTWPRIPLALFQLSRNIETSLNPLEALRFGFTLVRVGPKGLISRQITREMTTGFITDQGAQVLDPHWSLIHPMIHELFGSR